MNRNGSDKDNGKLLLLKKGESVKTKVLRETEGFSLNRLLLATEDIAL